MECPTKGVCGGGGSGGWRWYLKTILKGEKPVLLGRQLKTQLKIVTQSYINSVSTVSLIKIRFWVASDLETEPSQTNIKYFSEEIM